MCLLYLWGGSNLIITQNYQDLRNSSKAILNIIIYIFIKIPIQQDLLYHLDLITSFYIEKILSNH